MTQLADNIANIITGCISQLTRQSCNQYNLGDFQQSASRFLCAVLPGTVQIGNDDNITAAEQFGELCWHICPWQSSRQQPHTVQRCRIFDTFD